MPEKFMARETFSSAFFSNPIYYVIWILTFVGQVIIVQFGGIAFSTSPLNLEQWIWCILLGLGTLIWQQIVTSIPTSCVPKSLAIGRQPPPEPNSPLAMSANDTGHHHHHHHDTPLTGSRSGQILWIRGLTRLQTQLRVIRAFKSTLEDMEERRSVHSIHSYRSTRSYLNSRPMSDISYIDEEGGNNNNNNGRQQVSVVVNRQNNGHSVTRGATISSSSHSGG